MAKKLKYRAKAAGHTHRGKPVAVGDVIELRPEVAERYKDSFERVPEPAVPAKATGSRAATDSKE